MIGIPLGLFASNGIEWYIHKVWQHEYAIKNRNSPLFVHIVHHKAAKLNNFRDDVGYGHNVSLMKSQTMFNERVLLIGLSLAFAPLFPVAPFFTSTMWYGAWNYYRVHRNSHLDPEYARTRVPWHYDHHMNSDQNANWTITKPWFDYIMGTRVIDADSVAETNPLGIKLHPFVEKRVNRVARRLLPQAFVRLESNLKKEINNKQLGIDIPIEAA